jgi:hypothetical protein
VKNYRLHYAGLGLLCVVACSANNSGELMLAITSDLPVPSGLDAVQVVVLQGGQTKFSTNFPLGGDAEHALPATLAILPSANDPSPADIRVIGLHQGQARILREVVVIIPTASTVLERVDLQYVCAGKVTGSDPMSWSSTCQQGATCIAGVCQNDAVDSSTLPPFDPTAVFGGGTNAGDGTCFDVGRCFASATTVTVGQATGNGCTVLAATATGTDGTGAGGPAVSSMDPNLNFAFALPPGSDGTCDSGGCIVPIDQDTKAGWTSANGTIQLPVGLCQALGQNGVRLVYSTSCASKLSSVPACNASSGGNGMTGPVPTADAGVDSGGFAQDAAASPDQCPAEVVQPMCAAVVTAATPQLPAQCQNDFQMVFGALCDRIWQETDTCRCTLEGFYSCLQGAKGWSCTGPNAGSVSPPPGCMAPLEKAAQECPDLAGIVNSPAPTDAGACTPRTCADQGRSCGLGTDGCGGQLACGNCSPGFMCNPAGACVPGQICAAGFSFCNGACIPTSSDNNNCGGCGIRCPITTGIPYFCNGGKCVPG